MSPMILVFILLITVVMIGLVVTSAIYRARRRGHITGGIPHAARPLADDRSPPPAR
jgi:hypothetical protein